MHATRLLVLALTLIAPAIAAQDAMALSALEQRGRTLAVRHCAQCHAIGKTGANPRGGAPALRHLDQRVNLDTFASRLRQGLMSTHQDMPIVRFNREDSRAMVAYLRSIQGR
jgi:cytochrome c